MSRLDDRLVAILECTITLTGKTAKWRRRMTELSSKPYATLVERIELAAICRVWAQRSMTGADLWQLTLDMHGVEGLELLPGREPVPQHVTDALVKVALRLECIQPKPSEEVWYSTPSADIRAWFGDVLAQMGALIGAGRIPPTLSLPPALAELLRKQLLAELFASPRAIGSALESVPSHGAPGFSVTSEAFVIARIYAEALAHATTRYSAAPVASAAATQLRDEMHLWYLMLFGYCESIVQSGVSAYGPQTGVSSKVDAALRRAQTILHGVAGNFVMPGTGRLSPWRADGTELDLALLNTLLREFSRLCSPQR